MIRPSPWILAPWLGLTLAAAFALAQPQPTMVTIPTPPPVQSLDDLLRGAHLYGCQVMEHPSDAPSACLDLRRAILAAAQRGVLAARRHAFQQAAALVRGARDKDAAALALDRRAED